MELSDKELCAIIKHLESRLAESNRVSALSEYMEINETLAKYYLEFNNRNLDVHQFHKEQRGSGMNNKKFWWEK